MTEFIFLHFTGNIYELIISFGFSPFWFIHISNLKEVTWVLRVTNTTLYLQRENYIR